MFIEELEAKIPSHYSIPRWYLLALPDDTIQLVRFVEWYHGNRSVNVRNKILKYELAVLRYEVWDRIPKCKPKAIPELKPSKMARVTGYRKNSERKREVRLQMPAEQRQAIARKGGYYVWTRPGGTCSDCRASTVDFRSETITQAGEESRAND